MRQLLNEIKQLAQKGMENTIIAHDDSNKDIFLNIMLKSEVVLNKFEKIYSNKQKNYSKEETSGRTYERIDDDLKSDMYLVAYCFSNYEHTALYPQLSQDKSFETAAEKLGVKKTTLKNARDWFDGHNDSHRSGWWQQPLPEDMQKFRDIYDKKDRSEIIAEARTLLGLPELKNQAAKDFGLSLKQNKFYGKFKRKEEVEEFIQIVLNESNDVAKDLVEQASRRTFKACYQAFSTIYNESTDELLKEIIKYDTRCASYSEFSLWIRARFIKEIFMQDLVDEALKYV